MRKKNKKYIDHTGQIFNSTAEMCKHWGVNINTFYARRLKNWSLKECLETPTEIARGKKIADHLGQEFNSHSEMCEHWNIPFTIFDNRMRRTGDLEYALTGEIKISNLPKTDHTGREFNSFKEMCRYWNINDVTVSGRLKRGLSLKEALTKKIYKGKECTDSYGNIYNSKSEVAKKYKISKKRLLNKSVVVGDNNNLKLKPESVGEKIVIKILTNKKIDFTFNLGLTLLDDYFENFSLKKIEEEYLQQYGELKYNKRFSLQRPDFCLYKDNKIIAIIEYNGGQHYSSFRWHRNKEEFYRCKESDGIKRFIAKQLNVPFFEIEEKRMGDNCDEVHIENELNRILNSIETNPYFW